MLLQFNAQCTLRIEIECLNWNASAMQCKECIKSILFYHVMVIFVTLTFLDLASKMKMIFQKYAEWSEQNKTIWHFLVWVHWIQNFCSSLFSSLHPSVQRSNDDNIVMRFNITKLVYDKWIFFRSVELFNYFSLSLSLSSVISVGVESELKFQHRLWNDNFHNFHFSSHISILFGCVFSTSHFGHVRRAALTWLENNKTTKLS